MTTNEIQQTLSTWHGAGAEMWSYSTSHSRLVLRLRKDDKQVLHVIMEDVYGIFGMVAWANSEIAVTYDDVRREWIVRDIHSGFIVSCGLVQLSDLEPSW